VNYRRVGIHIAGDIIMSESPGEALRRWRLIFGLTQTALAARLGTSPSVVSDYESGRKSPGSKFVKRFVETLIESDLERGGAVVRLLEQQLLGERLWTAVLDMREFTEPVPTSKFLDAIEAKIIVSPLPGCSVYGYTVVDGVRLVLEVPSADYLRLYGTTSQRAAIFTRVSTGRSPLVAIKSMSSVLSIKPAIVVLHGLKPEAVDPLAVEIARREYIPLAVTGMKLEEMLRSLKQFR
jgi:putative transcriptional regulator